MHGGAFLLDTLARRQRLIANSRTPKNTRASSPCSSSAAASRRSSATARRRASCRRSLIDKMARYGREMVEQLLANPQLSSAIRARRSSRGIASPTKTPVPLFVQADFGLDANCEPQLVEIQGFPSLYAYQPVMAESLPRRRTGSTRACTRCPMVWTRDAYHALLRERDRGAARSGERGAAGDRSRASEDAPRFPGDRAGVSACAPWISAPCAKQGNRLFYDRDGKLTPIRAHLQSRHRGRTGAQADSDGLRFPRRSGRGMGRASELVFPPQQVLPALPGPSGGAAHAISRPRAGNRASPSDYVLKPLYSFAGAGVIVGPTAEQLAAVPAEHAESIHFAGARGFPPGDRDALGPHQDRGPHHVHLGWTACAR